MGREIRRVPANWQHPTVKPENDPYRHGGYQPMYDRTFAEAAADWKAEFAKWEAGERPSYCEGDDRNLEYWEWDSTPPVRDYYRPWSDEEATWFQCWETVSEGTPVSPPFATQEELIEYLATKGDFWDQKRGDPAWGRQAAERFVRAGWAPSIIMQGGVVTDGKLANINT